ncbi:hypothetical protein CCP4SC76_1390009 [Gammaproteobacteria bacterium]
MFTISKISTHARELNKEQHSTRYSKIIETLRLSSQSGSNLPEFLVIDFGLALRQKTLQQSVLASQFTGSVLAESVGGSYRYSAPEQMGLKPDRVGPWSDVYAYGRTLCYALFQTPNPTLRHWNQLVKASIDLAELLEACIEEDQKERPNNFAEVLDRLDRLPTEEAKKSEILITSPEIAGKPQTRIDTADPAESLCQSVEPEIASVVKSDLYNLLPNVESRISYLRLFAESIIFANSLGNDKWGVHRFQNKMRLLVGSIVVLTVHEDRIWVTLDEKLLQSSENYQNLLNHEKAWQWDDDDYPRYRMVSSKNGFYTLSERHSEVWKNIKTLHFEFIRNVSRSYKKLKITSQARHSPEAIRLISDELGQPIPNPVY